MSWTSANHTDADFESNSGWQAQRRNGDMQRVAPEGVDALRRRADSLLDEMMLGMVDIAPGDGGPATTGAVKGAASFGAPYSNGSASVNGSGANGVYQGAWPAQGSNGSANGGHEEPRNGFGAPAYSNGAGTNGTYGATANGDARGGEANGSAYTGAAGNGYYPSRPPASSDHGSAPATPNGNGGAVSHSQTSEPWSGSSGSPHPANGSSRTAAQPYSAYAGGNYQPAASTPVAAPMTGSFDANGYAESMPQAGHRNPHRGQTSLNPASDYRPEAGSANGMDGRGTSTATRFPDAGYGASAFGSVNGAAGYAKGAPSPSEYGDRTYGGTAPAGNYGTGYSAPANYGAAVVDFPGEDERSPSAGAAWQPIDMGNSRGRSRNPLTNGERQPADRISEDRARLASERDQLLISAEQRYAPFAKPRAAMAVDANTEFFSGVAEPTVDRQAYFTPVPRPMPFGSPVRRQSGAYAGTMDTGGRTNGRSNLLPRISEMGFDALNLEIANLRETINHTMAPGHEPTERARTLLEKAVNILTNDPARSAEVEYYLQQVRRITQRAQQTKVWSDIYKKRLSIYLVSWLVFAGVLAAAGIVGAHLLEAGLRGLFALAEENAFSQQGSMWLTTIAAGAFGAAAGALINVLIFSRRPYGYFDRKYGLRGLLLPILGATCGIFLAAMSGTIYALAEINPSQMLSAAIAPAALALLAGFSQEWFYGAR